MRRTIRNERLSELRSPTTLTPLVDTSGSVFAQGLTEVGHQHAADQGRPQERQALTVRKVDRNGQSSGHVLMATTT